jgi:signal transduction histidine kinase
VARRSGTTAADATPPDPTVDIPVQPPRGTWSIVREIAPFVIVGLVAFGLVAFAMSIASRRVGEREAITNARTLTLVQAQEVVEPALQDALADPDAPGYAAAVDAVAEVVERDVIDPSLVRVKIWNRDGDIVYSNEPRLIGAQYDLDAETTKVLDEGLIEAEVSDLSEPENRYERDEGKLLEVYLPIRTPDDTRLLFEAYYRYGVVSEAGRHIWGSFAPIALVALVIVQLVQIPLAYSLARRLQQRQAERESLLRRALEASDVERRRIASDLHDGVVQDLAGVAYSLAGAARRDGVDPATAQLLDASATDVRASIKSLRSLLVEIYPPNLFEEGLESALTDLLATATGRGVETSLDASALREPLPQGAARLCYRAAQEAVRNAIAHAHATHIRVRAWNDDDRASVQIADDGVGFEPSATRSRTNDGHFGLTGLRDLVTHARGTLDVSSAPGSGTTVTVEVPLR